MVCVCSDVCGVFVLMCVWCVFVLSVFVLMCVCVCVV